jgi:integrase/recombinase XerD
MIHLKTTCDRRRTKKDGSHPIVFRITVKGKTRDISSGLFCHAKYWDYKKHSVRGKSELLKNLNRRVKDMELNLLKRIREFDQYQTSDYQVQDVRNFLRNKSPKSLTVKEFWKEEVARMRRAKKHSNALNYESALLGLEKGLNMSIPFANINYGWLLEAETVLRERGLKPNTIHTYFKTLRSIFNKAINLEVIDFSLYPFRRFKLKTGSTKPRNLSLDEMRRYFQYVPTSDKLEFAHDMGKLIFCLRGINYTDLALLSKEGIRNNRLIYTRSKTQKIYSLALNDEVLRIMDKHQADNKTLLLSLLTEDEYFNKKSLPLVIRLKRKTLNKWLKKIGSLIGLGIPLSTYVFRYSHAGICQDLGYSREMISQSLGHSYGIGVTSSYLNDFSNKLIDDMNQDVINQVIN